MDKQFRTEIDALSLRLTEIERRLEIKTQECAGYCGMPTSDPFGMCRPCQIRERLEDRERERKRY